MNTEGDILQTLPKSRYAIRVRQNFVLKFIANETPIGRFEGIPKFKNMPDPIREDTLYVVSGIAASLIKRWNFIAPRPDSAGLERAADRTTTAARAFITCGEV
jgi:hypothetical protein